MCKSSNVFLQMVSDFDAAENAKGRRGCSDHLLKVYSNKVEGYLPPAVKCLFQALVSQRNGLWGILQSPLTSSELLLHRIPEEMQGITCGVRRVEGPP